MQTKYLRYTPEQLRSMGYNHIYLNDLTPRHTEESLLRCKNEQEFVKGKFAEAIDILFDSTDGKLDNSIQKFVSESCPHTLRSFVQNVMMCDVRAVQSAPDDNAAFEALIPRHLQSSHELAPYMDFLKGKVSESLERIKSHSKPSE